MTESSRAPALVPVATHKAAAGGEAVAACDAGSAGEVFRFVIPARLEYRDAARAFLAFVCAQLAVDRRLPEDAGHRVISAFVEAFNNAALHAYAGRAPGPIEVELTVSHGRLSLQICDRGQSFIPDAIPDPDLDSLPEGGLGLFIIRGFMDRVDYHSQNGCNCLVMEKQLGQTLQTDPIGGLDAELPKA